MYVTVNDKQALRLSAPAAEYARLVRILEGDPKSRPIRDLPDDVREELSHMHVAFTTQLL